MSNAASLTPEERAAAIALAERLAAQRAAGKAPLPVGHAPPSAAEVERMHPPHGDPKAPRS